MTATYDPSLVDDPDRNWVRLVLRDTDTAGTNASLQDEEIDAILLLESNKFFAAATLGGSIFAKWQLAGEGLVEKRIDKDLVWKWAQGRGASEAWTNYLENFRKLGADALLPALRSKIFRAAGNLTATA